METCSSKTRYLQYMRENLLANADDFTSSGFESTYLKKKNTQRYDIYFDFRVTKQVFHSQI